jgi:hypothetical protein
LLTAALILFFAFGLAAGLGTCWPRDKLVVADRTFYRLLSVAMPRSIDVLIERGFSRRSLTAATLVCFFRH